jgi:hypothetical protein
VKVVMSLVRTCETARRPTFAVGHSAVVFRVEVTAVRQVRPLAVGNPRVLVAVNLSSPPPPHQQQQRDDRQCSGPKRAPQRIRGTLGLKEESSIHCRRANGHH